MHVQHSPHSSQKISQERTQAVLTQKPRVHLDGTSAVPQLRANLERGPCMGGVAPSRKEGRGPIRSSYFSGSVSTFPGMSKTALKGLGEDYEEEEEEENFVEEESDATQIFPAPVRRSESTEGPNIAKSNQYEPYLLSIMQKMT
ncbi:hypothetical protein O181_048840 [Austropuccinia psidii MF-1]|uniref:Uncharacterized protein n=1 Tax=Austropuccinia psidii MF-1 TaxID=1389203 RepID=A0A9Q3HPJ0_9BASI|nr:hypothetical protein [Austropuccinia psidii MF-1]